MAIRVSPDSLRSVSSGRSYERGLDYARQGRVGTVSQHGNTIRATVSGSEPYAVRLVLDDGLTGHCSCPMGSEGFFCKHCVAVASVWSGHGPDHHIPAAEEPKLEDAVAALSREDLADLVLGAAERNSSLAADLLARAGMMPDPEAPALEVMRARVVSALPDEPLETWDATYDLQALLEELSGLVHTACSYDVVSLVEDAMRRWETAVEMVEHDAPEINDLGHDLAVLHHDACRFARPDPVALAPRLLDLHLHGYLAPDIPDGYADALGDAGREAFAAEVWRRFDDLPARRAGDSPAYEHRRTALIRLAEGLAETAGDVDLLVRTLAKDLSRAATYTRIVEALRAAGRSEEALGWSWEGLAAFGGRVDTGLLDAALATHEATGDAAAAREEARRWFDADPGLDTYQRLATRCHALPEWEEQRQAAIERVRDALSRPASRLDLHRGVPWRVPQPSDLVRLLLWDGDDDAAWRTAHESWISLGEDHWIDVAERRAHIHPLDAVPVYRAQVERDIERRKNDAYARAAERIGRIGQLLSRVGREAEFSTYVAEIRRVHKPKRNLMAAMNATALP